MQKILIASLALVSFIATACAQKTVLDNAGSAPAQIKQVAKPPLTNKDDLPTLVYYFADWCPYCKKFSPIIKKAQEEFKGKVFFYYVDVDQDAGKEFIAKFRPEGGGIPYTQFYSAKGEYIGEELGLISYEKLQANLLKLR